MPGPRFRAYLAVSLDGFIADADGGVGWLDAFHDADYGYAALMNSLGAMIMGRKTYDFAQQHGGTKSKLPTYVITSRPLDADKAVTAVKPGDLNALKKQLREGKGDIWLMGGGQTIDACFAVGAVDRLELHVIPILLGGGIPLFGPNASAAKLKLDFSRSYDNGVIELNYDVQTCP